MITLTESLTKQSFVQENAMHRYGVYLSFNKGKAVKAKIVDHEQMEIAGRTTSWILAKYNSYLEYNSEDIK